LEALQSFVKAGIKVEDDYFDFNDSIETSDDLSALFDVLSSVRDHKGYPAIMTPLAIVANPNFEAIKKSNYTEYVYETVLDTYSRMKSTEKSFDVIQEGISHKIFYPQFHGREHVNVKRWLKALNSGSNKERVAFEQHSIIRSEIAKLPEHVSKGYFPAFALDSNTDFNYLEANTKEGLDIFEQIYGFRSISFCPSCGYISTAFMEALSKYGIWGIQCGQYFDFKEDGSYSTINKMWGDKSSTNQIFWRRNCTFEPAKNHNLDWADKCLSEIAIAFRWGKPAVINSHRVNYIGSIHAENRDDTLKQLRLLLHKIVQCWPDVEFINSEQLYEKLLAQTTK
jgi:hypothetical protein